LIVVSGNTDSCVSYASIYNNWPTSDAHAPFAGEIIPYIASLPTQLFFIKNSTATGLYHMKKDNGKLKVYQKNDENGAISSNQVAMLIESSDVCSVIPDTALNPPYKGKLSATHILCTFTLTGNAS
jgi:hypothetical protein